MLKGHAAVTRLLFALASAVGGCISVPEGAFDRPIAGQARLEIADYNGVVVSPEQAPRWPRLRAFFDDPLTGEDEIAWLIRGPADAELIGDLERSPLLAAHRERAVPCSLSFSATGLELLPIAALTPGPYTFAIAAWALEHDAPLLLELTVSSDRDDGATMTAAWPADGSISVGTDLPLAWIAFDGALLNAERGVWLEGPDGLAIDAEARVGACEELGVVSYSGTCVTLTPRGWLAPLAEHRIVVGSEPSDTHGAPLGPLEVSFRTGPGPDSSAPEPAALPCSIDETSFALGCALISDRAIVLRVAASEPFALSVSAGERAWHALAPSADATLAIDALEPGETLDLRFQLQDSTGNTLEHREQLTAYEDLATLSITEVLADPIGAEPEQELVELWNFGETSVALDGLQLSDLASEPGTTLASSVSLDPDARVLLVADGFDPRATGDVAIPPGIPLIRVGKALGRAGLANRGEALFLRDRSGRRLSAAPATPAPSAGTCIARVSDDPRDGSASAFAADELARCTPGS